MNTPNNPGRWHLDTFSDNSQPSPSQEDDPLAACEGRTIWNSDGTDGLCLICPPQASPDPKAPS